jgi:hypothetical protein
MLIDTYDMKLVDILDYCINTNDTSEAAVESLIELMHNDSVLLKKMVEPYLKMISANTIKQYNQ